MTSPVSLRRFAIMGETHFRVLETNQREKLVAGETVTGSLSPLRELLHSKRTSLVSRTSCAEE